MRPMVLMVFLLNVFTCSGIVAAHDLIDAAAVSRDIQQSQCQGGNRHVYPSDAGEDMVNFLQTKAKIFQRESQVETPKHRSRPGPGSKGYGAVPDKATNPGPGSKGYGAVPDKATNLPGAKGYGAEATNLPGAKGYGAKPMPPPPPPPPSQKMKWTYPLPELKTVSPDKLEEQWADGKLLAKLNLVGGNGLKDEGVIGKSDPFCVIILEDGQNPGYTDKQGWPLTKFEWMTAAAKDTLDPIWNFEFASSAIAKEDKLKFHCWHKANIGKDDLGTGETILQIPEGGQALEQSIRIDLSLGGHLTLEVSWLHAAPFHDPDVMSLNMALLARAVYDRWGQVGPYHALKFSSINEKEGTGQERAGSGETLEADVVGLYKQKGDPTCVLAFSGTQSGGNVLTDLNAFSSGETLCGVKFHAGFYKQANALLKSTGMADISKTIVDHCSKRVIVTGHSLGGAIASIVAGCVNSADGSKWLPAVNPAMQFFSASALYTIGAPAISDPVMTNGGHHLWNSANGCFAGRRSFNYDLPQFKSMDMIASSASGAWAHPKVQALELHQDRHNDHTIACDTDDEWNRPESNLLAATGCEHSCELFAMRLGLRASHDQINFTTAKCDLTPIR